MPSARDENLQILFLSREALWFKGMSISSRQNRFLRAGQAYYNVAQVIDSLRVCVFYDCASEEVSIEQ